MPKKWFKATLLMLGAYWVVTILVILFIVALNAVVHFPSAEEMGVPVTQAPGYLATIPYHPLFNLPWIWFAWLYLRPFAPVERMGEAWRLGIFWTVVCVVKDYVLWVAVDWAWRMTPYEMYVQYQPYLTLIYLVILLAPVAAARLMARKEALQA